MTSIRRTLNLSRKIITSPATKPTGGGVKLVAAKRARADAGPPSAFILWSRTAKAGVEAENPGLSKKEIAEKLGELWTSLGEEQTKPFATSYEASLAAEKSKQLAQQAAPGGDGGDVAAPKAKKAKTAKTMHGLKPAAAGASGGGKGVVGSKKNRLAKLNLKAKAKKKKKKKKKKSSSSATAAAAAAAPAKKSAKKKKTKDPNAPKKPLTSFILFSAAMRSTIKATQPDLSAPDVARALGAQWRANEGNVQALYARTASEAKAAYVVERARYELSSEFAAFQASLSVEERAGAKAAASKAASASAPTEKKKAVTFSTAAPVEIVAPPPPPGAIEQILAKMVTTAGESGATFTDSIEDFFTNGKTGYAASVDYPLDVGVLTRAYARLSAREQEQQLDLFALDAFAMLRNATIFNDPGHAAGAALHRDARACAEALRLAFDAIAAPLDALSLHAALVAVGAEASLAAPHTEAAQHFSVADTYVRLYALRSTRSQQCTFQLICALPPERPLTFPRTRTHANASLAFTPPSRPSRARARSLLQRDVLLPPQLAELRPKALRREDPRFADERRAVRPRRRGVCAGAAGAVGLRRGVGLRLVLLERGGAGVAAERRDDAYRRVPGQVPGLADDGPVRDCAAAAEEGRPARAPPASPLGARAPCARPRAARRWH
jgi:hypothetical protein